MSVAIARHPGRRAQGDVKDVLLLDRDPAHAGDRNGRRRGHPMIPRNTPSRPEAQIFSTYSDTSPAWRSSAARRAPR